MERLCVKRLGLLALSGLVLWKPDFITGRSADTNSWEHLYKNVTGAVQSLLTENYKVYSRRQCLICLPIAAFFVTSEYVEGSVSMKEKSEAIANKQEGDRDNRN
jgi:hypothetical protein